MNRNIFTTIILASILIASSSFVSADFYSWITGKATTQAVTLNITVSNAPPVITSIFPAYPTITPTEAGTTLAMINFSASSTAGYGNLNDSTAKINATRNGETMRVNTTCVRYQQGGNNANYSCSIPMWYFDGNGDWNVSAFISDASYVNATNSSDNFSYSQLTAFVRGPGTVSFATIVAGAVNTTSSNSPLLLNNTGNQQITAGNLLINATSLLGETNAAYGIYAGNMSVGNVTGTECNVAASQNATAMVHNAFTSISTPLTRGNYSVNDGVTGQRRLYTCIRQVGNELTSQAYSTSSEGSWTIKVQ